LARPLTLVLLTLGAVAAALAYAPASAPAPPGYRVLYSGNPPGGGAWDLSAKRRKLSGYSGLCLSFTTRTPEGVEFSGVGCAGGSLRAWDNVFPISSGFGGNLNTNLVGGFAADRGRKAVISFADGKRVTVGTRIGPPGWRRALGEPVRFFVVNAFSKTKAVARSVSILDAHGRQVGRSKIGQ
jgi:hypothetical protein